MTTPCGQSSTTSCPGTETSLNRDRHTHELPPENERRSIASNTTADATARSTFDRVDAQTSNWCPTCQTTLMLCYRAGCPHAAADAMGYAYVAAHYALNSTRRKYGRAWSSEEEEWANHVAWRKARSRATGKSGDPANWPTQPTSLVNYFAAYVRGDIRTELQRKFGTTAMEDVAPDGPVFAVTITRPDGTTVTIDPSHAQDSTGNTHLAPADTGEDPDPVAYDEPDSADGDLINHPDDLASPSTTQGHPPTKDQHTAGPAVRAKPSRVVSISLENHPGGPDVLPGDNSNNRFPQPEPFVIDQLELESFRHQLAGLAQILVRELTGLPSRGPEGPFQSPSPRELMLTYLANINERLNDYNSTGWISERDLVEDRLTIVLGGRVSTKAEFDRLQSNIRRTRTQILAPACQELIDNHDNDLTNDQRTALKALLAHIHGERLTPNDQPRRRPVDPPTEAGTR